ncbi:hypothetical protein C343_02902 [Cryptococcus neoformans C23]|uniref:Uncharacterized protein n=1 Tax=Cryptococcus neoformans (strain H99 / ATCC 208821 / CBS 10515 / FGSC 9487) TaxID=235443 RepID=T2BMA6_CRYN9|nr:hypothetical protein CNAG_07980 [Cryptococcus neoformans var. grubii H99]AUB24533.1 hypothetical protein CKF44_07980 [Cryptococcus neoformans var. grubii]OWZ32270.1 hypothetical protein C347_02965 [Cryptococcus neoformans var. grubii AD2-60a]OWZ44117.1 hypothetical protein C343_02902 [Cryptococcus neoformans var. grubii C23]OWZ44903.1 hypothetical protein C353_02806 [Cryptococcus neoformans var. grubii AD1-83a]OWZ58359.1 hypothetical protein C368_00520 [Cryptococcus neoformans var. grubii 1|eukprot:XP_012049668.1 hypothetical protein CNAG_07980 [Cryptococcus neoformans var. grubii H99]
MATDELWQEIIEQDSSNKQFYSNPWPLSAIYGKTPTDATATGRPVYIPGDRLVNEERASDNDFGLVKKKTREENTIAASFLLAIR